MFVRRFPASNFVKVESAGLEAAILRRWDVEMRHYSKRQLVRGGCRLWRYQRGK